MKVRAKLTVESVTSYQHQVESVKLSAQYSHSKEDNTFAAATPSASMELCVSNPDLLGKFKPGDQFYADFTKVEKPE